MNGTIYSFSKNKDNLISDLEFYCDEPTQYFFHLDYLEEIYDENEIKENNINFLNMLEAIGFIVDREELSFIVTNEGINKYNNNYIQDIVSVLNDNTLTDDVKIIHLKKKVNNPTAEDLCVIIGDDERAYESIYFMSDFFIDIFKDGEKYYLGVNSYYYI